MKLIKLKPRSPSLARHLPWSLLDGVFVFFLNDFICLFLTALGLCCCTWAFL